MVKTIKHRFSIYRRFEKDIWGLSFSNPMESFKVNSFFTKLNLDNLVARQRRMRRYTYRIDIVTPQKRKKYMKWLFASLRIVKLFYLTLQYKQFYRMSVIASKRDGLFENHYCLILEGRLASFVYRTTFYSSMFAILSLIRQRNVFINGNLVNYVNYNVDVGDFVTFTKDLCNTFKQDVVRRLNNDGILFNAPRFMFVHFKLIWGFIEKFPFKQDFAFPVKVDMFRPIYI